MGDDAFGSKSGLVVLLEHFGRIEDSRDVRRIRHPLPEVLLLVVCGMIADCDDYENIAAWGRRTCPSSGAIFLSSAAFRANAGSRS